MSTEGLHDSSAEACEFLRIGKVANTAVLHVMRHSACSALATMGAPMIAIQALAGHESPQTTAKYMHLATGVQAAAVRLFDEDGAGGTLGARLDSSDPNP